MSGNVDMIARIKARQVAAIATAGGRLAASLAALHARQIAAFTTAPAITTPKE